MNRVVKLFVALVFILCFCKTENSVAQTKSNSIEFEFITPKDNQTLSKPHPYPAKGKIKNYDKLSDSLKNKLSVYLALQGSGEKIWHIQSKFMLSDSGSVVGDIFLGDKTNGNNKNFQLCLIAKQEEIPLGTGDNTKPNIPDNIGKKCIAVKRKD